MLFQGTSSSKQKKKKKKNTSIYFQVLKMMNLDEISFEDNLELFLEANNVKEPVKQLIYGALEETNIMARTNKPINADELWQLRGTSFLCGVKKTKI